MTFDGFFTGELDALETALEAAYPTYNVIQGDKTIGEAQDYSKPLLAIRLTDHPRDPAEPLHAFIINISIVYIKYDASGETSDAIDDAEVIMDTIDTWYSGTRNVSGNNVFGRINGGGPVKIPTRNDNFLYGYEIKLQLKKEEPDVRT